MQFALELTQYGLDVLQHEILCPAWDFMHQKYFKRYFKRFLCSAAHATKKNYLFLIGTKDEFGIDCIDQLVYELSNWKWEPNDYRFTKVVGPNDVRVEGNLASTFNAHVVQFFTYAPQVEQEPTALQKLSKTIEQTIAWVKSHPNTIIDWPNPLTQPPFGCGSPTCVPDCKPFPPIPGTPPPHMDYPGYPDHQPKPGEPDITEVGPKPDREDGQPPLLPHQEDNVNLYILEKLFEQSLSDVLDHPENYPADVVAQAKDLKKRYDANDDGIPDYAQDIKIVEVDGKEYYETTKPDGTTYRSPVEEEEPAPEELTEPETTNTQEPETTGTTEEPEVDTQMSAMSQRKLQALNVLGK